MTQSDQLDQSDPENKNLERALHRLGGELSQGDSVADDVLAKIAGKTVRPAPVFCMYRMNRRRLLIGSGLAAACLLAGMVWFSMSRGGAPRKETVVVVLPPEAITFEIGDIAIQCRYAFAVDNQAVLLCWRYSTGGVAAAIPQPETMTTVSQSGQTRYRQLLIATQGEDADEWQGTLLVAANGGRAVLDPPAVQLNLPENQIIRVSVSPRAYPRDELKHILQRAQEMMAASERPFTLEQIERLIEKNRTKAAV